MHVGARIDKLRIDSEPVADSLHVPFQEMGNAQLLPDLTRVARISALIKVCRSATDNLQLGDSRKVRNDFILNARGEVGVLLIVAEILERQHGDALFGSWACCGISQPVEWERQSQSAKQQCGQGGDRIAQKIPPNHLDGSPTA